MGTALIEVEDLKKYFPVAGGPLGTRTVAQAKVLDGVSFSIEPGQTLAVVGESGCGKTTVARTILRLKEPTAGRILVEDRDVYRLDRAGLRWYRKTVQAVFQDPWSSLSPRMRVRNIVAEPLVVNERLDRKEIAERVDALLRRVGLQPWQADLFPHEFSGGQRQRIALASALITAPRLLVLDEPTSALDVSVQAQVLNLLKDVQAEQGTSFLLISHDMATVRYVADRVVVMYLGQIVEEAPAGELLDDPKHPYTRALLASSLPRHPDDRKPVIGVTGELPSPLAPPSGCRFRTRCPFATEVCLRPPEPRTVGPGHTAACHLY